jgi:hypothetical protein
VHVAHGHGRAPFLLGAGLSLFVVWNAATLLGAVFAHRVPDPAAIGLDLVFPLAFLALLLPLLTGRVAVLVALVAGGLAWALAPVTGFGVAVLVAGVGGSTLGAALTRGTDPRAAVVSRAPKGRTSDWWHGGHDPGDGGGHLRRASRRSAAADRARARLLAAFPDVRPKSRATRRWLSRLLDDQPSTRRFLSETP